MNVEPLMEVDTIYLRRSEADRITVRCNGVTLWIYDDAIRLLGWLWVIGIVAGKVVSSRA